MITGAKAAELTGSRDLVLAFWQAVGVGPTGPHIPASPIPGGPEPDETPRHGPTGPRTPYPVDDPGIAEPSKPGSAPDYVPAISPGPGRM